MYLPIMSEMTELQREIMITARDYPRATQKEIAEMCDCSASYVSDVLNRYDSVDAFYAGLDTMSGVEPIEPAVEMEPPTWLEESEPLADDEEFEEAVGEGLQILGESLKKGYRGLKTLIRKVRN
jgi:transcriptional regulator with XRE-family HTH domain